MIGISGLRTHGGSALEVLLGDGNVCAASLVDVLEFTVITTYSHPSPLH
jgi:hypothetical protein